MIGPSAEDFEERDDDAGEEDDGSADDFAGSDVTMENGGLPHERHDDLEIVHSSKLSHVFVLRGNRVQHLREDEQRSRQE